MNKKIRKDIKKTLRTVLIFNKDKQHIGDGILNPIDHIDDEIWIQMLSDVEPDGILDFTQPELMQIHIGGTKRAFEQLATVLMALARIKEFNPDYSLQFDWKLLTSNNSMHIIIHKPVGKPEEKTAFLKIHNITTALFDKDGKKIWGKTR